MKLRYSLLVMALVLTACDETSQARADNRVTPEYFAPVDNAGEPITSEELAFHVQTVVEGLSVPWGMAFLPEGVMLVTERHGDLRLIRNGELHPEPLDGVPEVFASGQGGLLDVAAHPDYAENGWVYFSYSDPEDGVAHTALMRARLDLDAHRLVDQQKLFSATPKTGARQHFGSRIVFQDGYVYFSSGDRGVMEQAQNLGTHCGALMRLHDDGRVPEDNPFVDDEDALPEIWSYGHRNTQGLAIHPQTGQIFNHEHGPRGGDEINIIRKGRNYGWPEITYGVNYSGTTISEETAREGMESPLLHWTPSIAPSGMAFVTGDRYPDWQDNIMAGALAGQQLRRVVLDGEQAVHQEVLLQGMGRIRDVKMAPDGYLYLANESHGTIQRLVPVK